MKRVASVVPNYRTISAARISGQPGKTNLAAVAQVEEDLHDVVRANGPGKEDAQAMLDKMMAELKKDFEKYRLY